MRVWIDGKSTEDESVSVHDAGFLRGDGCFEALQSYDGLAFAVDDHVDRLRASAGALGLHVPPQVGDWIREAAAHSGSAVIRVVVTRGGLDVNEAPPRVVIIGEPVPVYPDGLRLKTIPAPWHSAGRPWLLAGAKTLSYGPNVNSSRIAQEAGFDDALLLGDDGTILEGPTSTIAWVVDGVVETPSLDLLILDSITRRYVIGLVETSRLAEGVFAQSRLEAASEVFVMSTVKEVKPVIAVDQLSFEPGPIAGDLALRFSALVSEQISRSR